MSDKAFYKTEIKVLIAKHGEDAAADMIAEMLSQYATLVKSLEEEIEGLHQDAAGADL